MAKLSVVGYSAKGVRNTRETNESSVICEDNVINTEVTHMKFVTFCWMQIITTFNSNSLKYEIPRNSN
jgi:hypothetical protein